MEKSELEAIVARIGLSVEQIAQERKELDKRLAQERRESDQRFEKRMNDLEQEHYRWVEEHRESERRLDERLDKLAKMYGGASNNQGDVAEEFFFNSLAAKPELNGIHFDLVARNGGCTRGDIRDQFDLILANGSDVFVVEIQYKLHESHIEQMLNSKQPNFSKLFPEYQDYRHHWSLASFHCDDKVKKIALANGISILQRKGDLIETIAA